MFIRHSRSLHRRHVNHQVQRVRGRHWPEHHDTMHGGEVHDLAEGRPQSDTTISSEYSFRFILSEYLIDLWVMSIQSGGSLLLYNLSRIDAALYICLVSTKSAEAARIDNESARMYENVDGTFIESMKVRLIVRSVPCAVTRLTMRISTILGVLIWEYNRNTTYSHPLKSFTAEFRQYNLTWPQPWERLDPINISPNVVSIMLFGNACLLFVLAYLSSQKKY